MVPVNDPQHGSTTEFRRPNDQPDGGIGQPCFGTTFRDAPFAPEMVVIPPGEFMMGSAADEPERIGSEGPRHHVTIAYSLAVGRYAVRFDQWDWSQVDPEWQRITGLHPRPLDRGWGRSNHPVVEVSWDDAQAYVRWLGAKTGMPYRLLSEAEWEYVCRAGTTTPFWWGSSITTEQANYNGNFVYPGGGERGKHRKQTVPVDWYKPNPFGLYQTHGNIWEWVEDCWNRSYDGAPTDGSAWTHGDGPYRILRGGSWFIGPRSLRAAIRLRAAPYHRDCGFGIRVARAV
jgi:formylglycine-generating enzyme required for sulfatase activity